MFEKVLIANRGEIALRVIRACREMGLKTVAVYSEADRDALHVRFADEDVCIGPPPARQSYLDFKHIIAAAEVTNAGAIHPGYGFLAENADFAEICESCGLAFIGPTPEQIRQLGDKVQAKDLMRKAGVPCIPGSEGAVATFREAATVAEEVGYPVILKAVAGGGGKGMRICRDVAELERGFHVASAEAGNAFGNPDLYLEKVVLNPHHVEIQVIGDTYGNYLHFGERDCSIQRRHQKLIEETPSPLMTPELRRRMGEAALNGAAQVGYRGVGTMEFLVDDQRNFYFMEMNTRIQVEHPVTEEAYEVDLLQDQIRVALGERLPYTQEEIKPRWAVIECRINAEDPEKDFRPTPGTITGLHIPGGPGVRVDRAVYTGYQIPPHYDSMIAKLIVRGRTRQEAVVRMRRSLEEFIVEGVPTTVAFHREIFEHPDFVAGRYDINFLEQRFRKGQEAPPAPEEAQEEAIAAGETVSRLTLLRGSEAGVLAEEETVETGAPDSASDNKQ
ncbi:MAG TPA: acetyl-CoA carboxylase biotin carboxylase subunit [candidate division Zixibacteria bacterium]|nr:acetyl-CoA carboxylase biotin carboxylase subunit [candidate division Zixibacteria bacterium]MDD4916947.1 acetyl-CoA carboxylase biotin carboxylase subunit [candidate division Zixibacteria bacterium]MDM7973054.1 acetyl-CoA carboxylase biotin carboxylase subunit [candidate division Zixibacteria bacterium]HOD67241.1 acetyl-CoA carboxylase biotin carboxylase subunit [candidate division Zixibacteria bacterium]HPM36346.1 acetyl-CoA carboxylase biotin carboxylase subunit [candidate division Zixiba